MITLNEYILKLKSFKDELDNCQTKDSLKEIEERLRRKLKEIFIDDDPFMRRCKSIWATSPKTFAEISSTFGNGYSYVSDHEEREFHKKQLDKNKEIFKVLLSNIIDTINKDGLPYNYKTATIININDSPGTNIATGIIGTTSQTSNIASSNFDKYYPQAVDEINHSGDLTKEQQEELLDMLALFKESVEKKETPKKTILKTLGNYSLLASSIGANMVTLWGFIEPYLNQLSK